MYKTGKCVMRQESDMPVCVSKTSALPLITSPFPPGLGKPGRRGRRDERMLRTGEREVGGRRKGRGGARGMCAQPGQSIPVSVCFLSPHPQFSRGETCLHYHGGLSSVHLNPSLHPESSHPSACCLGDGEMPGVGARAGVGLLPSASLRMQDLGQPLARRGYRHWWTQDAFHKGPGIPGQGAQGGTEAHLPILPTKPGGGNWEGER